VQRHWLCALLANMSLLWELAAPLALTSRSIAILFCFSGLAFHVGVLTLQGIDFVSCWCLCYACFLPDVLNVASPEAPLLKIVQQVYTAAPLAALYVALQLLACFTVTERFNLLTCSSVFSKVTNLQSFYTQPIDWWFVACPAGVDRVGLDHGHHASVDLALLPYRALCVHLLPQDSMTEKPIYSVTTNVILTDEPGQQLVGFLNDLGGAVMQLRSQHSSDHILSLCDAALRVRHALQVTTKEQRAEANSTAQLVELRSTKLGEFCIHNDTGEPNHHWRHRGILAKNAS